MEALVQIGQTILKERVVPLIARLLIHSQCHNFAPAKITPLSLGGESRETLLKCKYYD